MKKTTRLLFTLLGGTLLSFGLQQAAQAQTKLLSYTNTLDAWLTPESWSPVNDWNSGAVKTNATTANVRLNIGTNANQAVAVTYDAAMGTTIFNNAGLATIGMVIGAGNTTTGAVTIAGGTLVIQSGTAGAGGLLIGNPNTAGQTPAGSGQASLTLSGGNLIFTNANGNGFGVMSVGYRGGSTNGGAHFARGVLTIGGGSVATIERTFFGFTTAETGAQNTGIINLNAGGTLSTRNISARDGDANQMTSQLNFNGGTLQVLGPNVAAPTVAFIQDATTGSNLTVNVLAGGAIIDTAGFNATVNEGLLDAGGGGGLTKNGTGALTLTQPNTYTGATVLNGGSMSLIYPLSSSGLTLANGTTLSLTTRDHTWTNIVTSVTNATINLALGAVTAIPNSTTAVINTGTLNVSGVNVINITSGSGLTPGVVKLIDYTSSDNRSGGGTFVLGTLAPGLQATLVDGPNDVSLNVTLSVQSLIWTVGNGDWQTNGLANWNSGAGTYLEYPSGVGDVANFTDAAGAFYTVNVPGTVVPADVILNNSTNAAVTISGAGQIAGTNGITKIGNGTTLMSLNNTFTGVAAVNNGILQIENAGALGSTAGATVVTGTGTVLIGDGFGAGTTVSGETIILNGAGFGGVLGQLRGAIDTGANTWAGPIVLAANNGRIGTEIGGNITVAGPIADNGSNYIVLYRPGNGGTVTVSSADHSIAGSATFMAAGTGASVKLGVNNGFSTNILQVGPGVTDLNGFSQTIRGLETYSAPPGVLNNNGGGASTLTINTPATSNYITAASIQDGSSAITLVKLGAGRQVLNSTNANTYSGTTTVNEGELRISTTLPNSAVTVNSGGLLSVGGAATIDQQITVNGGGTLSPGIPFVLGVLTNTSAVVLDPGSTAVFHLDAGNTNLNDRLVANNVTYAGTLVVTNQGWTPVTNGQVFQLVSATTPSGNFANAASVAIYPAGTGTFNPATGELTIMAIPGAPTLNVVQTGNALDFSWSNLNGVYHLQAQTNGLSVGISPNWFDYSGGTTNSLSVPIDPANGAVFYRLVAP